MLLWYLFEDGEIQPCIVVNDNEKVCVQALVLLDINKLGQCLDDHNYACYISIGLTMMYLSSQCIYI